jgi:PAS domain S-box-containing protein
LAAATLIGSYNYALVALSVLIAMVASYAALDLASRVTAAGGWTRAAWLLGGAGAMGTGIWSMHYIGMLAFVLPVPVAYHWPTVLLSLFAAILASVVALHVVSRPTMGAVRALAGSVLMGAGIASMHYIGMAAMRVSAMCQYRAILVVLSVVFAVLISLAALWITFHLRDEKAGIGWRKIAGAAVMGAAIPVMHYTGMAAASFTPSAMPADLSRAVNPSTLGTAGIAAVTLIVLGLAVLTSWLDRRFTAQILERQEEKLQASEAYLSEAQRLSHTGSFGWRASTGEIIWSEETFRIFLYDRTIAPTVERILQRVHPEDAALVKQTIARASRDGKDFEHEYRLLMPDRSIRHVHVVARGHRDESGRIEFVGAVMDLTERKQDELLLAGEKRLLEMIARGESRTVILDALCRLVEELAGGTLSSILLLDPNAGCLRHGAAPSLPAPYMEAIDGIEIGPAAGSCGTAAYRGTPVVVSDIGTDPLWADYRDLALAHGLRACWSTPILSSEGRVLGTVAIYFREPRASTPYEHDIIEHVTHLASIAVEREQAEGAQLRLGAIVASSDDAIISKTLGGIITSWNAGAERIFGYTVEEAVGRPINMLIPPDRQDEESVIIDRIRRGESVEHFDTVRIKKDARQIYVSLTISPIRNSAGHIIGASKIARDITERKRAEEALRQAQAELAYVSRVTTMGELTASLAHEVRQPIAAAITDAKTCLRWLDRETPDIDEARAATLRVVEDGRRAADIINQIRLLFTKGAPQRERIDVNELIREMILLMRSEAVYGAISARTELAPDCPRIMGDRVQVQQVMMNLIMNAIDAMRDVEGARELVITSQRTEPDHVRVSVSDTGVGLPPQADQIFNAFFTTKPHGTGMGLSISRSIVESHGGRLWAADNRPRGATFHVTLPTDVDTRQ